jgi:DNA-binding NtrC family response regulator
MTNAAFRVLIVDDELNIRAGLAKALRDEAYSISMAATATEAWELFYREQHQLVITDLRMSGSMSGLDLVRQIKAERPEALVLLFSAHITTETEIEAIRLGALACIAKPFDLEMLRHQVRRAYEVFLAERSE